MTPKVGALISYHFHRRHIHLVDEGPLHPFRQKVVVKLLGSQRQVGRKQWDTVNEWKPLSESQLAVSLHVSQAAKRLGQVPFVLRLVISASASLACSRVRPKNACYCSSFSDFKRASLHQSHCPSHNSKSSHRSCPKMQNMTGTWYGHVWTKRDGQLAEYYSKSEGEKPNCQQWQHCGHSVWWCRSGQCHAMSCDVMSMPKLPPSCQHVVKTCQHMSKLAKIANAAACCHSSVTSPPGCTPRFGVAMLQCDLTVCCFVTVFNSNSTHPKHATNPMQDSF